MDNRVYVHRLDISPFVFSVKLALFLANLARFKVSIITINIAMYLTSIASQPLGYYYVPYYYDLCDSAFSLIRPKVRRVYLSTQRLTIIRPISLPMKERPTSNL